MRGKNGVLSVLAGVLCFGSAVLAGPQVLEVSPRYLEFTGYEGGADPNAQVVSIWNSGPANMDWTVTPDCNWVTVEPNSGTSWFGGVNKVNVIVDISGLSEGHYSCQLTVTGLGALNSPQIVDVNLFIYQPVIGISSTEFEFAANEEWLNPDDQILSISNIGTGTLNWKIVEDCNWLAVEPNTGSSLGEIDGVNIIVDISGLSDGIYNCQLTIEAGMAANSPQIVDVNLSIIGAATYVVPLPGCLGYYSMGASEPFTINLGVELLQINEVRFTCAGTVTAGLDYWMEPISDRFYAYFDTEPGYIIAVGPAVGENTYPLPEYFSDNPRFEPMFGATWDFLLDGQADGLVVLSALYFLPEFPPISLPSGYLQAASIEMNALPLFGGDVDRSAEVDLVDFAVLGLAWGTTDGESGYNVDCDISEPSDGVIDSFDLAVFCESWLAGL
ncbi:MAG: hypothetical protein JSW23_00445 [Planctomycetota bacterium]|nr:MAG: hypothetical protein JSW23_00445 [Planctomycetota bacterium]